MINWIVLSVVAFEVTGLCSHLERKCILTFSDAVIELVSPLSPLIPTVSNLQNIIIVLRPCTLPQFAFVTLLKRVVALNNSTVLCSHQTLITEDFSMMLLEEFF